MASRRQLSAVLLLFVMVVSDATVLASRSLKDGVKVANIQSKDLVDLMQDGQPAHKEIIRLKKRMDVELADYAGTGANRNHDPRTPGRF